MAITFSETIICNVYSFLTVFIKVKKSGKKNKKTHTKTQKKYKIKNPKIVVVVFFSSLYCSLMFTLLSTHYSISIVSIFTMFYCICFAGMVCYTVMFVLLLT